MHSVGLIDAFRHSPIFFLAATMVGGMAFVLAVVALLLAMKARASARMVSVAALGATLLTVLVGVLGRFSGRSLVDEVVTLPSVSISRREQIRVVGYAEADWALWFALGVGAVPFLLAVVAVVLAFRT